MGDSILWKYWLAWALCASPALPLGYAWRRLRLSPRIATLADILPLSIASISTLWFDAVVANWHFLGPLYSRLHYVIIGGNLVAVFLAGLLAFLSSFSPLVRRQRLAAALGCVMLALEWGRIGIINR
jgi:hypothetical protein